MNVTIEPIAPMVKTITFNHIKIICLRFMFWEIKDSSCPISFKITLCNYNRKVLLCRIPAVEILQRANFWLLITLTTAIRIGIL